MNTKASSCLNTKAAVETYLNGFHNEELCGKMKYSSFGETPLNVSLLGLGTSELALCYGTPQEDEGIKTVIEAVKAGINYIDSAPYYGQGKAETVLGKALEHIPRSTYYLATKVGRYGAEPENMFNFSEERTLKSVEESMIRMGVDYIDIMQVHDVEFAEDVDVIVNETLPALQKLKDKGKVKYIGVTGYSLSVLKEVIEKSKVQIDMVLSYCRCTMFDTALKDYIPFFKERKLGIVNAAVLGMGLLTHCGGPDWHPAKTEMKLVCREAALYCKAHNVNVSKISAAYSFQQPHIDVHLIGMQRPDLLSANLSSLIEELTPLEKKIQEDILERYFRNLKETHWEDKEVKKYWENIKKLQKQ